MGVVDKPWGYEELIFTTQIEHKGDYETLAVKKIVINGDEMTSYHTHKKINEVLYVNQGLLEIRLEDDLIELEEGEAHFLEEGEAHQIQNITGEVVEVIEVAFPFDSEDKDRLDDPYKERR